MQSKINRFDLLFMLVITVIYSVFAFVNLGDMTAPQTFCSSKNEYAILTLDKPATIEKMMIYYGICDFETTFTFDVSTDGNIWYPMMIDDEHIGKVEADSCFAWKEYSVFTEAKHIRIYCNYLNQDIGEIGLFDGDGNKIALTSNPPQMTDEQSLVPTERTYMNGTYFDEVYHPRTAYEIIHELPIYESTHPPLGKVIMSLGIYMFGMVPFGWRFMGTIAGILMLPVMYVLIKKLFGKTNLAIFGTVLFAADFMHFSLTRMATIDSFVTLFIMLSYLFVLIYISKDFYITTLSKQFVPLFFCGLFFGISCATKWIGIYSALGLAIILAAHWIRAFMRYMKEGDVTLKAYLIRLLSTIGFCLLSFVLVPAIIYFGSYLPQMRYDLPKDQQAIDYVWSNQVHMLTYHGEEVVSATHDYSSKWYTWLVDGRPLYAFTNVNQRSLENVSSISIMGNPLLLWIGLLAMIVVILGFSWRNKVAGFIATAYLSQLVWWIPIERTTFIYHYFSCIPFLVTGICYFQNYMQEIGFWMSKLYIYIGALVVLLFIMFYPAISGLVMPEWYAACLRWLPGWVIK